MKNQNNNFLIKILIFLLIIFSINSVSAQDGDFPFNDIKKTDELYSDLNLLYRNNVIKATSDNNFYPDKLIPRDELLSIVVGVGCKDCMNPSIEDFIKYDNNPFIDVNKILKNGNFNSYFYCVAIGKNDGITQGYLLNDKGEYTCENNQTYNLTPFCPSNNTTRIEASAILLRYAKIWDESLNSMVEKTITISDVDNRWYGYARKGIEIGLIKINAENKIFPNESITRREFIHMAAKIFGMNFCEFKKSNIINDRGTGGGGTGGGGTGGGGTGDIKIYDKSTENSCSGSSQETKFPNSQETVYDLTAYSENKGDFLYEWEFTNIKTGEVKKTTGKCLNNYDFITDGKWIIKLKITDKTTGKSTTTYSQIYVNKGTNTKTNSGNISLNINANPLFGDSPLPVDFTSTIGGSVGKITYIWDFGDGNTGTGPNPNHVYQNEGIYNVTLKIIDENGNTGVGGLTLEVVKNLDTDKDGLKDKIDTCPLVVGPIENKGCPDVDEYVGNNIYPPSLSSEIKIFDKNNANSYNGNGETTKFPSKLETVYDFYGYTVSTGEFNYAWQFTNKSTGEILNVEGKFLNNFDLKNSGLWNVKLVITDTDTGKNSTSYSQVVVSTIEQVKSGDTLISSYITGTPISGVGPLLIDFTSFVKGGDGEYVYSWKFGDGGVSTNKNPDHTYTTPGIYTVILTITDGTGKTSTSQIQIEVIGLTSKDTDGDGVDDKNDYCPTVSGSTKNNGCPDINKDYGLNNACLSNKAKDKGGIIEGLLYCTSCPCVYSIEYIAALRGCDIIFPAITSPDKKTLFSRGEIFQTK